MKNLWTDQGAREAVALWGSAHGESFALRLYSAKLIGQVPSLVLHGGGNVSVKSTGKDVFGQTITTVHVKASGRNIADLGAKDLPALDLTALRRLRELDVMADDAMINEVRRCLLDTSAPTPSIETCLHAFLPHKFIDHSHADAITVLTGIPKFESKLRAALGKNVAFVPYVTPGFELAKAVVQAYEANPEVDTIVLMQHGLITFAEDARSSYERHIEIVSVCESLLDAPTSKEFGGGHTISTDEVATRASLVAPILRGLLARPTNDEDRPYQTMQMEWRGSDEIVAFTNRSDASTISQSGPLTCDHLIRTKARPMFVADPKWSDAQALRVQLEHATTDYRNQYVNYLREYGGDSENLDTAPRIVILPGAGIFCWGPTKREAIIAADIAEHTLLIKARAESLGPFHSVPEAELFTMEFRSLQQSKLTKGSSLPLAGRVVVISGGAGAIGSAIAQVCIEAGACVALTDNHQDRLDATIENLIAVYGQDVALPILMDVTNEESVRKAYAQIVRTLGGVDVIVPNAGIAHVAPIETLELSDFERVMQVNATGNFLFMREGIRILKQQGIGGDIVINASKNVFAPGKDFGAYSASKAAAHQLGKVAAIELAKDGIRVNMINADAVFGDAKTPSGLWETVGPQRAKSRGMKPEDLPDYYRKRNLLGARVTGRHVGNAVVFFASHATPTTGATLPIDGGVVEAFPR